MYQYSTNYPLCETKVFIQSIEEAIPYFVSCVKFTQDYRSKKGKGSLTINEIENSHRLVKIDESCFEYKRIFGREKENCTGYYEHLEKTQQKKKVESENLMSIIM